MDYLEKIDWKGIKKDLQKGLEKGMAAMKKGAIVAQKKAGELTEEGKRQFKILTLKTKVHEAVSDLGARVYSLMNSAEVKNPGTRHRSEGSHGQDQGPRSEDRNSRRGGF